MWRREREREHRIIFSVFNLFSILSEKTRVVSILYISRSSLKMAENDVTRSKISPYFQRAWLSTGVFKELRGPFKCVYAPSQLHHKKVYNALFRYTQRVDGIDRGVNPTRSGRLVRSVWAGWDFKGTRVRSDAESGTFTWKRASLRVEARNVAKERRGSS